MTHGDKAKAKTGKSSSQTSAKKVSKAVEAGGRKEKGGKGGAQAAGTKQAGREKTAPALSKGGAASVKDTGIGDPKAKARPANGDGSGFTNAAVGSAFKHALKKYSNAFRRLTD